MKALSIKEPWLSMIVDGEKTIETRTWKAPEYLWQYISHPDLLLVGSKNPKGRFAGKAACLVKIATCRRMCLSDEEFAGCKVYPRAISWILRDIRPVWPVPIKGQLGIYNVPDELIRLMSEDDPRKPSESQVDEAVGQIGQYELDLG